MKKIINFKKRISFFYEKNNIFFNKNSFKINNFLIKKKKIIFFITEKKIMNFFFFIKKLLILNTSYIYFNHLKIYGLGFRISIISFNLLRIDFGWSHVVFFEIPKNINVLKKKNEFLFYSNNLIELKNFTFLLTSFYKRSPYTLKGIFSIHDKIKVKIGKQRQK